MSNRSVRSTRSARTIAALATVGFAISSVVTPGRAKAYSSGSGAVVLGIALYTSTTTSVGLSTAGGVILTVQSSKDDRSSGKRDERDGEAARVLDAALLSTESDLNLQLELLVDSPEAFAQFDRELAAGAGASVDALRASTGLDVDQLRAHWNGASMSPVASRTEAVTHVRAFLEGVAADLVPSTTVQASLATGLFSEASETAPGRRTTWLAEWLGVSPEVVRAAVTEASLAQGIDGSDAARAQLLASPDALLLDAVRRVEAAAPTVVHARFEALRAQSVALGDAFTTAG